MTTLVVREACDSDIAGLLPLYQHLSPEDPPIAPNRALDILGHIRAVPNSAILIGILDTRIVTSCTLFVLPNLSRGGLPYALIENVVTHSNYRNRGFGTNILHAARDRAFTYGCYKVMLLTGSTDPATLQFYANAGFKQTKTRFQIRNLPSERT